MIKPTKVICKRTSTSGKSYWWDENATPPTRHERDNRMLIAGNTYEVVDNPNDSWDEEKRQFTFTIRDHQGHPHLFFMYDEQDKQDWPDICNKYGPRDYAKWFYTPEELVQLEQGTFKLDEDIYIKEGNYHWVKLGTNWIIAHCSFRHSIREYSIWTTIGSDKVRLESDFEEIGEQVISYEQQKINKEKAQLTEELLDEVFVLVDSINKNDPDRNYPSVEYVMPFVNEAIEKYFDASMEDFFDKNENKK